MNPTLVVNGNFGTTFSWLSFDVTYKGRFAAIVNWNGAPDFNNVFMPTLSGNTTAQFLSYGTGNNYESDELNWFDSKPGGTFCLLHGTIFVDTSDPAGTHIEFSGNGELPSGNNQWGDMYLIPF